MSYLQFYLQEQLVDDVAHVQCLSRAAGCLDPYLPPHSMQLLLRLQDLHRAYCDSITTQASDIQVPPKNNPQVRPTNFIYKSNG